jgi:isochorismate synthase EntC
VIGHHGGELLVGLRSAVVLKNIVHIFAGVNIYMHVYVYRYLYT